MIKKITQLPLLDISSMSLAKIYAQYNAFSGSALENNFYVQTVGEKITALFSQDGGSVNLWCENADYEELKGLLTALCPSVIFTESKNCENLGVIPERIRNSLFRRTEATEQMCQDFSLKELYYALDSGSDVDIHLPSFEVFAPDVSHRLRHSAARAVLSEFGGALAFTYEGGAVMSGIAVSPDYRGTGKGKELLCKLLSLCNGGFFVAANDENTKFYLRNGFNIIDKVVFGRME